MKKTEPPVLLQRFFSWFCRQIHLEGLEGDLFELFERRVKDQGSTVARFYYLLDILSLLRSSVSKPINIRSKSTTMSILNNYIKTAFRLAKKRKSFTVINLAGLTLGITSLLFIAIFVLDELSYDRHISDHEKKFRVFNEVHRENGNVGYFPIVPPTFGPALQENFPEIKKAGRLFQDYGGTIFSVGKKVFSEKNGVYAELAAMEILDLELVDGSLDDLTEPRSILLSQTTFNRFFENASFEDQMVEVSGKSVKIAGIYKDLPNRMHVRPDYILSFNWLLNSIPEHRMTTWVWQQFFTYVELSETADLVELETKVQEYVANMSRQETDEYGFFYIPNFQRVTDIHLHSSNFQWDIAEIGNYQSIIFLSTAAGVLLLIAILNFINLTSAQSIKRSKEVGIRKYVGAGKTQLLIQHGIEALMYCVIAGVISIALLFLCLDYFNNFSGKSLMVSEIISTKNVTVFIISLIILALLSSWYPAMIITRFQPIQVLHGKSFFRLNVRNNKIPIGSKETLVGVQYVLSVGLILISLIIRNQYQYMTNADMGFDKENIMVIPLTRSMRSDFESTRNLFSGHNGIDQVTYSYGIPGGMVAGDGAFFPDIRDKEFSSNMFIVDANYLEALDMKIIAGRGFSTEMESDKQQAFVLNETAARNLGFTDPEESVGTRVKWKMWVSKRDTFKVGRVVGVVSDFNFKSMHHQIESVIMHIDENNFSFMLVKFNGNDLPGSISYVEEQFKTLEPNRPFEYEFVDQSFSNFYKSEQKMRDLFALFTLLAIITAAIGLYGLVSYSVISKGKEISIRKVLGAGVFTIFSMLIKRYFVLALVCMTISIPIAHYLSSNWLENFAYQTSIGFFVYLVVVVTTVGLTAITVAFQAWHGAKANPATGLRTE